MDINNKKSIITRKGLIGVVDLERKAKGNEDILDIIRLLSHEEKALLASDGVFSRGIGRRYFKTK